MIKHSTELCLREVDGVKEFEVTKTATQAKPDIQDLYNEKPIPLPQIAQPKRILKPSELAKKLFCPAFVSKAYLKEPLEKQRQFEVLAQTGRIQAIVHMAKIGFHLVEPEAPSGQFKGKVDFVFEDAAGHKMKVEAKSSKSLRPWDIVQSILYAEPEDKIAVSSLNEFLRPEGWLVEMVNSVAKHFAQLYEESPDFFAGTYMPYPGLCEKCANSECPYKKRN